MRRLLFAFAFTSFALVSHAETLKEKRLWREADEAAADQMKAVNETCGTSIELSYAKETFKDWDFERVSPGRRCVEVLRRLRDICSDSPEGKTAVQQKIKHAVCAARKDDDPERQSLSSGKFEFSASAKRANEFTDEWLKKNLGTLVDAEKFARAERGIKDELRKLNSRCETDIGFEIDRKSFAGRDEKASPPSRCDAMAELIFDRCKADDKKAKVKSAVKTLVCRNGKESESHFTELKSSKLYFDLGTGGGITFRKLHDELDALLK